MPPPRRKPSRSVVEQPRASAAAVRSADIIRIGLADDHALFRGELRTRLEEQTDFAVAGEASSPNETVAMCSSVTPHVLLLDVAMRGAEGFSLLERVRNLQLDTRIVMLTTAMPRNEVVRALQLGARGIVLKDAPAELLFKSIRRVRSGEFWVGRDMVGDLVHALAAAEKAMTPKPILTAPRAFALTARELEIVCAVASGYTNRQMAEKFSIAEDTIKHHLTSIFDKTGVSNRLELALFAIHHRLA
jgi:two-component system nitrate/nitrite response regulator NarL